jgi:hypothetical protein
VSTVEGVAARIVADADPGTVRAYYNDLQASVDPASLAAAVAFRLDPMIAAARDDVDRWHAGAAEAEQRLLALERLAAAAQAVALGVAPDDPRAGNVVSGQNIAVAAIAVAKAAGRHELGYREWFQLFREAGYVIESPDPLAVFLTSLTRARSVERVGERTGVYRVAEERPMPD